MPGFPLGHALVIGVGAYADRRWNVPTAARDAIDAAAALVSPEGAAYDPRFVDLLIDGEASQAGVAGALGRLADRAAPDSVALVSFTCHGATGTDGLYYLATADARFADDQTIAAGSALSVAELARLLRAIPARRVLLIVNACFAGRLGPSLSAGGVAPEPPVFGQLLSDEAGNTLVNSGEGQGRAIIAAGRPEQRSYFVSGQDHSIFGQALIDTLLGAGVGGASGYIGLFELYEALHRQVVGAARRQVGQAQEPTLTLLQGAGPFPVASFRGATGSEAGLSTRPPVGAAVREVPPITVNVTNKRSVVSFDGATVLGGVSIGQVVEGDSITTNYTYGGAPAEPADEPKDPRAQLPILRARVEVARNVDEDARDDAANKLRQAERALAQGDRTKTRARLDEALAILRAMSNGYVNSVVRKLEALLERL